MKEGIKWRAPWGRMNPKVKFWIQRGVIQVSRSLVGALFIFSGVIKMNDPIGFSFKLEEYFGEDVLNLPFLQPLALQLAIFLVGVEVLLGVFLLLGTWKRWTLWSLAAMMAFFTFLTFYSAYYEKVTDCGCFGDAIPLTPWESFGKDVVLSILIGMLILGQTHIGEWLPGKWNRIVEGIALVFCVMFTYWVLNHGPLWDFRAYKPGTDLVLARAEAEELGLEGDQWETYYTLIGPGDETIEVSGTAYVDEKWYEKPEYVIQEDAIESKLVKEGYKPKIHDFNISIQTGGVDSVRTQEFIASPNVLWLIAYDLSKANIDQLRRLVAELNEHHRNGVKVIGMTASSQNELDEALKGAVCDFPWAFMDGTTLKTIQRSNPGVTHVKNGIVKHHWHYNDAYFLEEGKAVWPE